MGKILYECHFEFHFMMLLPFIMLICSVYFPIILKKECTQKNYNLDYKIIKKIFACITIIMIIVVIYEICFFTSMYKETIVAYQNGDYQIAEGYVEKFDPMPYSGHSRECFEINNVKFEYSDYTLTIGYHNAKSHGGVIKGDGQHLKIGYVRYGSGHRNVIVYS